MSLLNFKKDMNSKKKNLTEHKTSRRQMYLFHDQFLPFFGKGGIKNMSNALEKRTLMY
jgi:hypothetical protein